MFPSSIWGHFGDQLDDQQNDLRCPGFRQGCVVCWVYHQPIAGGRLHGKPRWGRTVCI